MYPVFRNGVDYTVQYKRCRPDRTTSLDAYRKLLRKVGLRCRPSTRLWVRPMLGLSLSGHATYAGAGSSSSLTAFGAHATAQATVPVRFIGGFGHGGFGHGGFGHGGWGHGGLGHGGWGHGGWGHGGWGHGGWGHRGFGYGGWGHRGGWGHYGGYRSGWGYGGYGYGGGDYGAWGGG